MPEPTAVDRLADGFWERFKELQPISATINGDNRYDGLLPDPGPEGRAERRAFAEEMSDAALGTPEEGLSVEDHITLDVLRVIGEIFAIQDDQRIDTLQVVDQMGGPQQMLPRNGWSCSSSGCTPIPASWPPIASSCGKASRAA